METRGTTDDDGDRNVTKNGTIKGVARRRESESAVNAAIVRLLIYCAQVVACMRIAAYFGNEGKRDLQNSWEGAAPCSFRLCLCDRLLAQGLADSMLAARIEEGTAALTLT